jgi:hypothetical protein
LTQERDDYLNEARLSALDLAKIGELSHAVNRMTQKLLAREDTRVEPARIIRGIRLAIDEDKAGVIEWVRSFS